MGRWNTLRFLARAALVAVLAVGLLALAGPVDVT